MGDALIEQCIQIRDCTKSKSGGIKGQEKLQEDRVDVFGNVNESGQEGKVQNSMCNGPEALQHLTVPDGR